MYNSQPSHSPPFNLRTLRIRRGRRTGKSLILHRPLWLIGLILCAAGVAATGLGRQAPDHSASANRVTGFTAWDDDYLYFAVQVDKPTLTGKNSAPFSNPLQDDAVIISLQPDDNRAATAPTSRTVSIALSAAGGAQLYSGAGAAPLFNGEADIERQMDAAAAGQTDPIKQQAARDAVLARLIKFQVTPRAGAGVTGAHLPGYTLELAVPWVDLGGRPDAGAKMGFNVAAQSVSAGSPPLQSLSPEVQAPADLNNPSKWTELLLANSGEAHAPGEFVCPRVFASKPVIDGLLEPGEWNALSEFVFGERGAAGSAENLSAERTIISRIRPDFVPHLPTPAIPLPVPERLRMPERQQFPLDRLVFARYEYWYQADPHKEAPVQHILRPDGSTALAQHPMEGAGPWFSYDQVDWQRSTILQARKA
ncbi:MAG TPA: hypothetical protein VGS41_05095, partial [Chthonomonadales bacterium]|nr:hypothetical protein [Chthonomonadales bacterium]